MSTIYAFVTYETRYAPCGGIAAVTSHLPTAIQLLSSVPTIIITPFHHRLMKKNSVKTILHTDFEIEFGPDNMRIDVHKKIDNEITTYFLKPENPDFFAGFPHPYYPSYNLRRDSMLFGKATARFISIFNQELEEEHPESEWVLFLQEWEAATTALALSGEPNRPKIVLTLHNSYDSGGLPDAMLSTANIDSNNCPGPDGVHSPTVLQRVLPLIQKPVLTVSRQFATDFFRETLHTEILAAHLQNLLKGNVHGIDNGPFRKIVVDQKILKNFVEKDLNLFREWKHKKRVMALKILDKNVKTEKREVWGDLQSLSADDTPWLIMAGRDDPRQKGFEIAVSAIARFLEKGCDAHFFFFPILGDEGLDGLNFLKELAFSYPDKVTAFPIRFETGYFPTLEASTYGMMPSLYEPFGMANEFYYYGTVAIGRATGGLIQQIVPLRGIKSFNRAVKRLSSGWYDAGAKPTGILFHEDDKIESEAADWHHINGSKYQTGGEHPDRIEQRMLCKLFQSMVDALESAINDAIDIYRNQPETYYNMLINGIDHIQRNFSWEKAAKEYIEIAANSK